MNDPTIDQPIVATGDPKITTDYDAWRDEQLSRRQVARRILNLPYGDKVPFDLALLALSYQEGERPRFDNNIPTRMTYPPYVRPGDVVDVNPAIVLPSAGMIVAVALDLLWGKEGSYPDIFLGLVFTGQDGRLYVETPNSLGCLPLTECRVIGVVSRHQWPTSKTGYVQNASIEGLFFLPPPSAAQACLAIAPEAVSA